MEETEYIHLDGGWNLAYATQEELSGVESESTTSVTSDHRQAAEAGS